SEQAVFPRLEAAFPAELDARGHTAIDVAPALPVAVSRGEVDVGPADLRSVIQLPGELHGALELGCAALEATEQFIGADVVERDGENPGRSIALSEFDQALPRPDSGSGVLLQHRDEIGCVS